MKGMDDQLLPNLKDGRKGANLMTETKIAAEVVIDPMVAVLHFREEKRSEKMTK
jgi:hypothetical protein